MSSPTYALSKNLAQAPSPLVGSFVSSSSEFVSFSKSITIPEKYELVLFDVVLLFTNAPIDLALSVVEKRLDDVDASDRTPLPKEALVSLLWLSTTIYYNGTVYQQIFGTAMGSPVSVVVANIVMEHIEDLALTSPYCILEEICGWCPYAGTSRDDGMLAISTPSTSSLS